MALWKELSQKEELPRETERPERSPAPVNLTQRLEVRSDRMESLIGADLTIEGKIEGTGHVRIAGRFKGDIQVDGDLTIERGAHISGEVRAGTIVVGGEVEGNIHAASRVEFLESGLLIGDLKAGSLTVAAGSRMRGKVEFGWDEREAGKLATGKGDGTDL